MSSYEKDPEVEGVGSIYTRGKCFFPRSDSYPHGPKGRGSCCLSDHFPTDREEEILLFSRSLRDDRIVSWFFEINFPHGPYVVWPVFQAVGDEFALFIAVFMGVGAAGFSAYFFDHSCIFCARLVRDPGPQGLNRNSRFLRRWIPTDLYFRTTNFHKSVTTTSRPLTGTHGGLVMEGLPQELIDKTIDHVDHADLRACSLVARCWVERSHWRMLGGGYCSFTDRRQLDSPRNNLLTKGSVFVERVHTLTLSSTAVQAWTGHFRNVDVVLPRLESLIIADAQLRLDSDVAVLKRNFGDTLLSLSLNGVSVDPKEFYPILSSFPNLDNLSIARLDSPQPPSGDTPACPRTQGKLTLVGAKTQDRCVPFLVGLPIQFRALYFCDIMDIRKVYPLVRACASTLTILEIRGTALFPSPQPLPILNEEKQTTCSALMGMRHPWPRNIAPSSKPFVSPSLHTLDHKVMCP